MEKKIIYSRTGGVISALYLMYVRRVEARKCAWTGTGLPNECCHIKSPLILPHGLNGIVIARNVEIGNHVTIYQHATIAEEDRNKKTIIEDGVIIGAGAVILKNVHIGKNAKIGANAVVVNDVPAYSTVVGVPARIVKKEKI